MSAEKVERVGAALTELLESHSRQLWLEAPWEKLDCLFCDLAQLLDGWHQDGTAWSEWDESVRKRLTEMHHVILAARAKAESTPKPSPALPTQEKL